MIWQDIVFGVGTIIFSSALLPSIFSKDKPAISTSILTGITLIFFAVAQASLSLWFASVTNLIASALWITLAVQKYRTK